jgi:hypothetical protein
MNVSRKCHRGQSRTRRKNRRNTRKKPRKGLKRKSVRRRVRCKKGGGGDRDFNLGTESKHRGIRLSPNEAMELQRIIEKGSEYTSSPEVLEYLEGLNLHISSGNANAANMIKNNIYEKSFRVDGASGKNFISNFDLRLKEVIDTMPKSSEHIWTTCAGKCNTLSLDAFKTELKSTAYFLRVLANTTIRADGIGGIDLNYINPENTVLTGKWVDDAKFFTIKPFDKPGRLIMGFGPSASGKTFWAKNLIEMMRMRDVNFPDTFLSIDGGLYRELSQVYQTIVDRVKKVNIIGFSNLVLAGISLTQSSMFTSSKIKKRMISYLETQHESTNISLYVPETLGDCGSFRASGCNSKIGPYVNISKDTNWIGTMIYQHKTGRTCPEDVGYKCKGATESGMEREVDEGKQYSNAAFNHSYNQGIKEVNVAPGPRFVIHNSGGRKDVVNIINKSIIYDMRSPPTFTPAQQQEIENKFNCKYSTGPIKV